MTSLSLFTGIGGMDMAFEATGGRVIAMCERDSFCRLILNRHWPDIPVYDDVKTMRGEEIGTVDIIYGGFPCQPFSFAGRQEGKDDDRYLWPEFSRLVGEIRPSWVLAENVPGIMSLAGDDVCEDLERQGYAVGVFHYEAAAVGAPHRRARIFFVAHAKGGRPESRERQPQGGGEKTGERADHQTPGPSESSGIVSNPGLWVCERGAVRGTLCGEYEKTSTSDAERSVSTSSPKADSPISHTEGGRRRERATDKKGRGKRGESGTWDRSADIHPIIPDSDGAWGLQQERQFSAFGRWAGDICKDASHSHGERFQKQQSAITEYRERTTLRPTERSGRRRVEPDMGGVVDGLPLWLDGAWWCEPDIPRITPGKMPYRAQRLKALGNAVVPAQIYPLFAAIAIIHNNPDWSDEL